MYVSVNVPDSPGNRFDGVYWDYFNDRLWIAPAVTDMAGEPDFDGDGIAGFLEPCGHGGLGHGFAKGGDADFGAHVIFLPV